MGSRGGSSPTTRRCSSASLVTETCVFATWPKRSGSRNVAAQRIVADLVEAGFVERKKIGRRNHYSIDRGAKMRHPAQMGQEIGDLLDLLSSTDSV